MSDMIPEYDIIICTTAVNRSEFHYEIFKKYMKFLDGLKCKWIINIDKVVNEPLYVTINNFKNICNSELIDLKILPNTIGGTKHIFYSSAMRLAYDATDYNSKYGVLWLEDDWNCIADFKLKDILTDDIPSRYIQLSKREKCISFHPGIFSWDLFKKWFIDQISDENNPYYNQNPERACCCTSEMRLDRYTHLMYNCFDGNPDQGRTWSKNNGMDRTFRKTAE